MAGNYVCGNELRYTEQLSPVITRSLGRSLSFVAQADMALHHGETDVTTSPYARFDDIYTIQLHIQPAGRVNPFVAQYLPTPNDPRQSGGSVNR